MRVAVVGLGKVGLPLAVQYASRGLDVVGCDLDADRVARINGGDCPIAGEEGLEDGLRAALASSRLRATVETTAGVSDCDVVVLIVPVGLDAANEPDFTHLDGAVADIANAIRPRTLVSVECTVPVGTTRNRLGAKLRDALVVASPERVSSGHILRDLRAYPKIIGAIDDESWAAAESFYSSALDAPCLLRVRSPETAEFAKVAEGVYRDVNIALASELARYADGLGIDVSEAIAAANSQPYSHIHQPGVGVGGHCVPVYPHFIPRDAQLVIPAAAREINESMAAYGVDKLAAALGSLQGTTVLILGLAYRPDVREAAHSSALALAAALRVRGARPLVHDPLFSPDKVRALGLEATESFPPSQVDAVIVQAWHSAYHDLEWRAFHGCRAVLDGRNVLDRAAVESAGLRYLGIGR